MLSEHQSGVINTGNILNVNKKAGQKTAEEVSRERECNI